MFGERIGQYLTYQHNTQTFFRNHSDKFDGIIVPLSIATVFKQGTGGFVLTLKKPYAIDPRTPVFQATFDRSLLARSHHLMAEIHGQAVQGAFERGALRAEDFPPDQVRAMVSSVLDFQRRFAETSRGKVDRYARLLGEEPADSYSGPQFLIPPYFRFDRVGDPWYPVTLAAAREALKIAGDIPVAPVVHFPIALPRGDIERIASDYSPLHFGGLILFVNDFQECRATVEQLRHYVTIVRTLVATGKPVLGLFGGYFSAMLRKLGLRVFSNGVGYGEYRDSGYHSGGQARRRYYFPAIHRYLSEEDAQSIIRLLPRRHGLWYTTPSLQGRTDSGTSLSDLANEELLNHFMECREQELRNIQQSDIGQLVGELKSTLHVLQGVQQIQLFRDHYSHLERWAAALPRS